jgi:dihydroflavonol-4-reductase
MDLVTGATGHIGNVLVRELLRRGRQVRVLVRSSSLPLALQGLQVELARGDVLDPASLEAAMQGVEVAYHLAAKINLLPGSDAETGRVNVDGTRNVLAAVRQAGVQRLVFASSIYSLQEPPAGTPLDESYPFKADGSHNTYDASKARASLEVLQAVRAGLDAVLVLPTAVTGPYDFHDSEAGLGIRLYMRPGLKFYVEGAYDFVDVRDVAAGFIQAAEKGRRGETYILGGERLTVKQVIETVREATHYRYVKVKVPYWLAYRVAGLMPLYIRLTGAKPFFTRYSLQAIRSNSLISHVRAARELGFTPRPARQAITDSVRWFLAQEQGEAFVETTRPACKPAE